MFPDLGLEKTPEEHIERMVVIAREFRRVLRDDGCMWVNYGDCFATTPNGRAAKDIVGDDRTFRDKPFDTSEFLPQGNLMFIPHRVAIALQEDGWIARNDVVWNKPNPMPESVNGWRWERHRVKVAKSARANPGSYHDLAYGDSPQGARNGREFADHAKEYADCPGCDTCAPNGGYVLRKGSWRHTRSHEYVFQFCKSMQYFCNQEEVREALDPSSIARISQPNFENQTGGPKDYAKTGQNRNRSARQALEGLAKNGSGRNPRSVLESEDSAVEAFGFWLWDRYGIDLGLAMAQFKHDATNPDDVLDVPTQSYSGSHYATYPEALIAPLIRASVPRWCCPECGAPWAPVVEKENINKTDIGGKGADNLARGDRNDGNLRMGDIYANVLGYRPTCPHKHTQEEAVPGRVLDPFVGSGTTVRVAKDLLRQGFGTDISFEYLDEQAKIRAGVGTPSKALAALPLFAELP